MVIAIDGPSGAGKGTVARAVARELACRHVDTGAMYRALAWKALRDGADLDDEAAVARVAGAARFDIADGRIAIDGDDVSVAIRTPEIDRGAARVARLPRVREILVARQRAMREEGGGRGLVMEGRDIGSVVFPDADLKIYLDANPEERARRRASDPAHHGGSHDVATVATEIAARDRSDSTRAVSPLKEAEGAVRIDTTGLDIQQVVEQVLALVRQRLGTAR
jgi:cytidylate kinase